MKKRGVFLIVTAATVLLCLCLLVALLITRGERPATVTSELQIAEVDSPTEEPTATDAPLATNTPRATSTAIPTEMAFPTETSTNTPAVAQTGPAGIGSPRATWDQQHTLTDDSSFFTEYDNGNFAVGFRGEKAWYVDRYFRGTEPTLTDARSIMAVLLPADSILVETYSPEGFPELTVDLYYSEWLEGQFDEDAFIEGEPGNFIVIYNVFDGRVPRTVIGLGNNP